MKNFLLLWVILCLVVQCVEVYEFVINSSTNVIVATEMLGIVGHMGDGEVVAPLLHIFQLYVMLNSFHIGPIRLSQVTMEIAFGVDVL